MPADRSTEAESVAEIIVPASRKEGRALVELGIMSCSAAHQQKRSDSNVVNALDRDPLLANLNSRRDLFVGIPLGRNVVLAVSSRS